MSSRYRNKRRGAKWPKLNLPNEGIHTENGHLFHHETPQPLNDAHKQRLLECGIQLDSQDSFSPEEDERIRKNWCSFVRKYSLPFENAQDYDGSNSDSGSVKTQRLQRNIITNVEMWPRLCKKLDNRSAYQIQNRIHSIFDHSDHGCPLCRDFGACMNEVEEVKSCAVAVVPETSTNANGAVRHREEKKKRNHLLRYRHRDLFETVVTKSSLCHSTVAEYLLTSPLRLKDHLSNFNWVELEPSFRHLHARDIRHEWWAIIKRLRASLLDHIISYDQDQAWTRAMDEVIPRRRFSIHDWIYYVKTLRKCIDCSATEVRPRHIDRAKLVDKLSKHGVVDRKKFNLGRCPRFIRIKAFIRARDSSVFCHLRPSIGARDKLRIMEECYRRLVWQREDNYTSASLPRVKMSLFAECVIDRMRDIDSLWQPPAVFKQWITPWFHVSMSSKQSSSLKARNPAVDLLQLRHSPYDEPERSIYGAEPLRCKMRKRGCEQDCISIGSEVESVQTGQVGGHESLVRQDSCASHVVTEELFSNLKEESDSLGCSVTYSEESYGSKRRCGRMKLYRQVCAAMEQNTDQESNTLATEDYWMELLK